MLNHIHVHIYYLNERDTGEKTRLSFGSIQSSRMRNGFQKGCALEREVWDVEAGIAPVMVTEIRGLTLSPSLIRFFTFMQVVTDCLRFCSRFQIATFFCNQLASEVINSTNRWP